MLKQLAIGEHAKVVKITGGKTMVRKMMSLGIKTGSNIELLHHRGNNVVVRSNGTRIAIGASIANLLRIERLPVTNSSPDHKSKK